MSDIADQVATHLFRAAQAVGHCIEGVSQRADFASCFDGNTLAQVASLHPAGSGLEGVDGFEDRVGKQQG